MAPRHTLADLRRFLRDLTLDNRKPFVLQRFQSILLKDYFAGVPQTVIVIPKGNGKTTLLAGLALYHVQRVPDAESIVVAASRDQAGILLHQATGLIRRSEGLSEELLAHQREIRRVDRRGRIRILASDVDKTDGLIFTQGLIDELHRHRSSELYGLLRDGLDKRGGQMATISTAGARADSPLGRLRKAAHEMPSLHREGVHNYACDGNLAWHEWCLEDTDDLRDIRLVKQANPASWQTQAKLLRRRDDPSQTPAQWARFACGVWTEGEEPWIQPEQWDRLAVDVGGIKAGDEIYVGVRAGKTAGLGIVSPRADGAVAVAGEVIRSSSGRVPLEAVEMRLMGLQKEFTLRSVAFDPEQFRRSAELLAERGLPMTEVPQRPNRLAQASTSIWRLVSAEKLAHNGSPELRAQVLAGKTKESTSGWRLEPTEHNTALIALAMAVHEATQAPTEAPRFVVL